MNKNTALGCTDISKAFFATILLRLAAVVVALVALPLRQALPLWMAEWCQRIFYPLLLYNLVFLLFYNKISGFLQRYPFFLLIDLFITVGILQIGGGWRSSYFGYTLTAVIIFTIFDGRRGAYLSAAVLAAAALIKDPSGGLPSVEIFDFSNWDIRIGTGAAYVLTGLIVGYFSTLLQRLEILSKTKIEETRKLTVMEEKTRMALELHDGAKQMITAMLLKMNPLIKRIQSSREEVAEELRWLWRGMNYLKSEFDQVMDTLKEGDQVSRSACDIVPIIEEEARLAEMMTGFSWWISAEPPEICIPLHSKLPLRRFMSEALMNAWKHSGGKTGTITIQSLDGSTIICIGDNGKGFDYTDHADIKTTGLKSLKSRARELNGELAIESAPGKGCKVVLTLLGSQLSDLS